MMITISQSWQTAVFTLFFFFVTISEAYIELISTNDIYPDRTAGFGPDFPLAGMSGYLIPVEAIAGDHHGCEPIDAEKLASHLRKLVGRTTITTTTTTNTTDENADGNPPPIPWIALVRRGKCPFVAKVRAMQTSGASAVVVGDNQDGPLIKMYASGNTSDVQIPSAFVMRYEYEEFQKRARRGLSASSLLSSRISLWMKNDDDDGVPIERLPVLAIRIFPDELADWPLLDLISVVLLGPLIIILGLYTIWRCRDLEDDEGEDIFLRRNPRDTPAPRYMVNNLPKKTFHRAEMAENDHDVCAICLEDFEEGEELRVLPCKHDFHRACIDQWLLTRKRTCPICKADSCPEGKVPVPPPSHVVVPILPGSDGLPSGYHVPNGWFPWNQPNLPSSNSNSNSQDNQDNRPQRRPSSSPPSPGHNVDVDNLPETAPLLRVGGLINEEGNFVQGESVSGDNGLSIASMSNPPSTDAKSFSLGE